MTYSPPKVSQESKIFGQQKMGVDPQRDKQSLEAFLDSKVSHVVAYHIFPSNIPLLGQVQAIKSLKERSILPTEPASSVTQQVLQEWRKDLEIDPEDLYEIIEQRGLRDADSQFKVLRLYLEKFSVPIILKIESFAGLSLDQKLELFKIALVYDSSTVNEWRAAFSKSNRQFFSHSSSLSAVLEKFIDIKEENRLIDEIFLYLTKKGESIGITATDRFLEKILQAFEPFLQQKEMLIWIAFAFDRLALLSISTQEESLKSLQLIECLSKLEDSLKYPLVALFFDSYYFPLFLQVNCKIDNASLPLLLFTLLNFRKECWEGVCQLSPKKLNHVLSTILHISLSLLLSDDQKSALFRLVFLSSHKQEIFLQAVALKGLLAFRNPKVFEGLTLKASKDLLPNQFLKALQHLSLLSTSELSFDFSKYFTTFASFRRPHALIDYAIKLQRLEEEAGRRVVLKKLKEFFHDVMQDRFHDKRYDSSLSPHLSHVFNSFPALEKRWRRNEVRYFIDESFLGESLASAVVGCIVEESDAVEDLLLCTTEVLGSCLSIEGNCEDNKALLAYILDGKNKLLCIKSQGKMIGRAIVRLLWNENLATPVLFLETFYSSLPYTETKQGIVSPYDQLEKAIVKAALAKASSLSLPLLKAYSSNNPEHLLYEHAIVSLGGRAPYECCDAIGATGSDEQCLNSVFSIPKSQLIPRDAIKPWIS